MSLFARLLQAVQTWRRHGGRKVAKRASVTIEQLDHRQLLSVNFTGNVPVDFPATQSPGVVVIPTNPSVVQPSVPTLLQQFVNVSGFAVQDIRVSYDASTDVLSIGLDGPPSGNAGQGEVIAGDADDNGNPGTVNPNITNFEYPPSSGIYPFAGFQDFPDFTGSEYMGAVLSFTGASNPQIVAGFSEVSPITPTPSNPVPAKPYEVALANSANLPIFGTSLPQFAGGYFMPSSPTGPNLEFSIANFSQLYQEETGQALTPGSVIYVGAQAGSSNDAGIGELTFPPQAVTISEATLPGTCPPQSPTIYVNPHEHRIIDTHHRDLVRVTIEGTSGFKVKDINPSTVTLDGVPAVAHITRKVRRDEFPTATYVFVADQLNLPPGLDNVTLAGTLNNGNTFSSSRAVLNVPNAGHVSGQLHRYMGGGTIYRALSKIEAKHPGTVAIPSSNATAVSVSTNPAPHGLAKLKVSYAPVVSAAKSATDAARAAKPRTVVKVHRADTAAHASPKLPTLLRHSMSDYLDHAAGAHGAK